MVVGAMIVVGGAVILSKYYLATPAAPRLATSAGQPLAGNQNAGEIPKASIADPKAPVISGDAIVRIGGTKVAV